MIQQEYFLSLVSMKLETFLGFSLTLLQSSSVDMLGESLSTTLMIPGSNLAVWKHLIKVNTNKSLEFLAISW